MKKTVKGFTLIELIVVMAIFSIILASAFQLLAPMSKLMTQSQTTESGNAYTTNIVKMLEGNFASVEHLDCYNTVEDMDARALDFAEYYYEGILRAGSTTAAPNYGTGRIHVMVIDNSQTAVVNGALATDGSVNSVVQTFEYTADFTTGAVTVTQDAAASNTSAINQASYDDFNFEIKLGNYDDTNWDEVPDVIDLNGASDISGMIFSIRASTNRDRNGRLYQFYNTASTPLVNAANVSRRYFGLNEVYDTADLTQPHTFSIAPIDTVSNLDTLDPNLTASRKHALALPVRPMYNVTTNRIDSYMFVYSYGSEIDIS